jgi:predicted transcriptional regulator
MVRMNHSNRGRLEILGDILCLSKEEISKTHIMYRANLSHDQVSRYLRELQDMDLIERVGDKKLYRMTDRGRSYLDSYESLKQMLENNKLRPIQELYPLA